MAALEIATGETQRLADNPALARARSRIGSPISRRSTICRPNCCGAGAPARSTTRRGWGFCIAINGIAAGLRNTGEAGRWRLRPSWGDAMWDWVRHGRACPGKPCHDEKAGARTPALNSALWRTLQFISALTLAMPCSTKDAPCAPPGAGLQHGFGGLDGGVGGGGAHVGGRLGFGLGDLVLRLLGAAGDIFLRRCWASLAWLRLPALAWAMMEAACASASAVLAAKLCIRAWASARRRAASASSSLILSMRPSSAPASLVCTPR